MRRFQLIFLKLYPYILAFAAIFALMFFGSQSKSGDINTPLIANFANDDYSITADQVTGSYIAATLSDAIALPSNDMIVNNYVTVSALYESTGTTAIDTGSVIEKRTIIDVSDFTGAVIMHTVVSGDTIASIIKQYNTDASSNQVRWSNGLKTTSIKVGDTLYVPSRNGIVYKTKAGDTVAGLASKYKSNAEEIIEYNNLELAGETLDANLLILLPGGELPEKERPEYVKPTPRPRVSSNTWTRDTATRHNRFEIKNYSYWYKLSRGKGAGISDNPNVRGQCTWFAWYWRRVNTPSDRLPSAALGNANAWDETLLRRGYTINHTPSYGAIMQSDSGRYGHVAVVVGVKQNEYITIQEMNFANGPYRVFQSTVYWADAIKYDFIHGK